MAYSILFVIILTMTGDVRASRVKRAADPSFPHLRMVDPSCTTYMTGQDVEVKLPEVLCQNTVFFPNYCRNYCGKCQGCQDLYPDCANVAKSIVCTYFKEKSQYWSCGSCPSIDILIPDETVLNDMLTVTRLSDALDFPNAEVQATMTDPACTRFQSSDIEEDVREVFCRTNMYMSYCVQFCGFCQSCTDSYPNCEGLMKSYVCTKYGTLIDTFNCSMCQNTVTVTFPDAASRDEILALEFVGCFPRTSVAITSTGETKQMKDIQVGDRLLSLTKDGRLVFSDVYALIHFNHWDMATYYTLETESGQSITLSPEHFVYVLDENFSSPIPEFSQIKMSEHVRVGDSVTVVKCSQQLEKSANDTAIKEVAFLTDHERSNFCILKASRIVAKHVHRLKGLFAPLTLEGTIVVDDVIASCYAISDDITAWEFLMTPLRVTYYFRLAFSTWMTWLNLLLPTCLMWDDVAQIHSGNDPSSDSHDDGMHWYAKILLSFAPAIDSFRREYNL